MFSITCVQGSLDSESDQVILEEAESSIDVLISVDRGRNEALRELIINTGVDTISHDLNHIIARRHACTTQDQAHPCLIAHPNLKNGRIRLCIAKSHLNVESWGNFNTSTA